jgi:hypothetical protein
MVIMRMQEKVGGILNEIRHNNEEMSRYSAETRPHQRYFMPNETGIATEGDSLHESALDHAPRAVVEGSTLSSVQETPSNVVAHPSPTNIELVANTGATVGQVADAGAMQIEDFSVIGSSVAGTPVHN